jgi:hypothetical protein
MNYLQSLISPSQMPPNNIQAKHKTSSQVKQNHTESSSVMPRSSEIDQNNMGMLQAWVSGGSVTVAKPSAKGKNVAQKNAGQRLDFFG